MAGIVITGIENIDEEEDYEKIKKERVRRLRETTLNSNKRAIEEKKQEDEAKKNATANRQNQTSVEVQNTPNGTKTTTTTSSTDGSKTAETVETSGGGKDDDPFTEEVEGADNESDKPKDPPKENENINEQEAKKDQEKIEGFNQSQIDSKKEEELLKQGVDTSDVKKGEENKRESIPDNPKENPADPVVNKNGNNGNADTKTEHCTKDNKPDTKQQQEENKEGTKENVLIGEDPNAQKSEIIIPDKSATCPSPNLNSLNDFQKEVLWVALDMLKWQPTTDINSSTKKKSRWDYYDVKSDDTKKSFYNSYTYPNDPIFGRFNHKGMLPLDRLFMFYHNSNQKNPEFRVANTWAWCAVTASVIYMYAMLQMRASHKDSKKQSNNGSEIWSPFENKKIQIPFKKDNNSALCIANNSKYFDYKLSWEPTPGALFWKINNDGAGSDCGHTGIVVDKTKDGSIITIEGNGGQDLSLRVWPRDNYYQDAWRISHDEDYVKSKIFGLGSKASLPSFKSCTADQIKRGRLLPVGHCHYERDKNKWGGVKIPFPYPTDSQWHWIFLNPATDTELLDIKGKPSREGNPLPEIYSLLDGFYNPEGSKGTANSSAVR